MDNSNALTEPLARRQRIETLQELETAALNRRSVENAIEQYRMPAAVVMSMQARIVLRMIRAGLYLHPQTPKRSAFGNTTKLEN